CEVSTEDQTTFDQFVADITASPPQVVRTADDFDVQWASPSNGEMTFGWDAPFVVDGHEQDITDFPRHDSRWGRVERLQKQYRLSQGRHILELDFDTNSRAVSDCRPRLR
ncbi:MAG: hypothetical protein HKN26_09675, partial [Acidimicrobiales bacterium]|nr:hypothetical protein [Acidimicrobiales bacterium]